MKTNKISCNSLSTRDRVREAFNVHSYQSAKSPSRYAVNVTKHGNVYIKKSSGKSDELDFDQLSAILVGKR